MSRIRGLRVPGLQTLTDHKLIALPTAHRPHTVRPRHRPHTDRVTDRTPTTLPTAYRPRCQAQTDQFNLFTVTVWFVAGLYYRNTWRHVRGWHLCRRRQHCSWELWAKCHERVRAQRSVIWFSNIFHIWCVSGQVSKPRVWNVKK